MIFPSFLIVDALVKIHYTFHSSDIMKGQNLPPREWQVGKSKVFIRQKVYEPLEDQRLTTIRDAAVKIQAAYRMHKRRMG